jgi:methyl-accepting chemotaxis protein
VSSQVERASSVARGAAAKGSDAQQTIRSLSQAAEKIGAVVRLIAEIAAKTNLLTCYARTSRYIRQLAGHHASSTRAIPMILQG